MFPEPLRNATSSMTSLSLSGSKWLYHTTRTVMWVVASSATILALPVMFESERAQMEEQQLQQQRQVGIHCLEYTGILTIFYFTDHVGAKCCNLCTVWHDAWDACHAICGTTTITLLSCSITFCVHCLASVIHNKLIYWLLCRRHRLLFYYLGLAFFLVSIFVLIYPSLLEGGRVAE